MSPMPFFASFNWVDWLGFAWMLMCWVGYEKVVERGWNGRPTLQSEINALRMQWARQVIDRDPRIVDVALIANLLPSLSFYANTSIYIIAALFAALGTVDQLVSATSDLPFSRVISREAIELKLLVLLGVFVVAYFKFTWSLRQFNLLSITLGSIPNDPKHADQDLHIQRFAAVNTCAGTDFNRGLRAYYFGMAVMAWMVNAWLYIALTTLIVIVMARREFSSPVLKSIVATKAAAQHRKTDT